MAEIVVTEQNFETAVLAATQPVVLLFLYYDQELTEGVTLTQL